MRNSAEEAGRLSEESIRKELRSEALQHPATMIPLALAGLSLIHLMGISPFPVGAFWAIILLIGSLAAGAGSFFWIYSVQHGDTYAKLVREIIAQQELESREANQAELERLREDLETGLTAIDATAGLKALTDLDHQYEQLLLLLNHQEEPLTFLISEPSLSITPVGKLLIIF